MKSNHRVELLAFVVVVLILAASTGWFAWPSLTGTEDEPDSLRFRVRAWVWPVQAEPQMGQTLPSPNYLDHPPQYFPPTPPYPLPKEMEDIPEAQRKVQQESQEERGDK
jgi:hypothetical protein